VLYPGREALLIRKQFVVGMNYFDERFGEYWADADLAIKTAHAALLRFGAAAPEPRETFLTLLLFPPRTA